MDPELEQPYDQIINSTDYLELINAIEHGHVCLRLTAPCRSLPCVKMHDQCLNWSILGSLV